MVLFALFGSALAQEPASDGGLGAPVAAEAPVEADLPGSAPPGGDPATALPPEGSPAPSDETYEPVALRPRGTVIFVHGLYMRGESWAPWEARFQAAGWATSAPSWAGRDGVSAALRADPPEALRDLTLDAVIEGIRAEVSTTPGPVVLVGHSMGGLIVQRLAGEGLGDAVIAIDAAPPRGLIPLAPSFLLGNRAVFRPGRRPMVPSERWFKRYFAHTLSDAEARAAYDRWLVPESRVLGRGPLGRAGKVHFRGEHPPLLLVGGRGDRTIPVGISRRTERRWRKGEGHVSRVVKDDVSHWLILDRGWEALADEVLAFAEAHTPKVE